MQRPRYADRPLPPYSYVPGHTPHPVSDPRGHSHGRPTTASALLNAERWFECDEYAYGVDLFNHGFYWEAHEAWESLWLAAGRRGPTAIWLKTLIKLAAALVKLREGNGRGAVRHALRAQELLEELLEDLQLFASDAGSAYCGASFEAIANLVEEIVARAKSESLHADPQFMLQQPLQLRYPS